MLDSLAPSVGSAHGALSESMAARVAISTATTGGSPLDASESTFQAGRLPTRTASQTSAIEASASLGWPHRLASALRRVPDTAPAGDVETDSPPLTTCAAEARARTKGSGPRPVGRSWRARSARHDHAIVAAAGHFRACGSNFCGGQDTSSNATSTQRLVQFRPARLGVAEESVDNRDWPLREEVGERVKHRIDANPWHVRGRRANETIKSR